MLRATMTDPQPSAANSAPPSPDATADAQPSRADTGSPRAGRSRLVDGRALAGFVGGATARIGNWLASIGWGKFFLLAVLLIALGGMADSMFSFSRNTHRQDTHVPVEVKISVDSDGLHITRPPQSALAQQTPDVRVDDKGVRIKSETTQQTPDVRIDDKGVRIKSKKDGRDVSVVIDRNGVRVDEGSTGATATPPKSPAPQSGSGEPGAAAKSGPTVTVPPGMINDPEKVAEAVDAAKDQIEEIVQEQVDRKVARLRGDGVAEPTPWPDLAELAVMLAFALLIVKIAMGSKRRAESRAQAADAAAADEGLKRQLAEAQLKTMQAQVEPHFLFNTLASVDYLIETDPARASRMQKNLIQYLRAALPQMRQASSTLGQEMALCRSYLEILKVRMDDRLQFAITMPAGLSSAAFPPMMLQTLVENSIKHGLEPKPEGGALTLNADVVDGNLRVAVSDSGLGFGAAGLEGGGVGLNNVRERLQALFGARGRLTIEANAPGGTIATIVIPYTVGATEAAPQASPQPA
jgi:hypothetical protein